ncbi:hypothetical protein [Caballeronia humi]|jgi:hypothetical protein|uniref:Uncharacterized protein n=1 Tax=Caballeronia humi TaxID=326474 RepID=A0A158IWT6_9BURK|nr:hypothetical protein [Caballeronia humi]SAL61142.1 hypothetical protein AWB65_05558 [Caballeronia humi]
MALDLTSVADVFKDSISSAVKTTTTKDLATFTGFAQSQFQSLVHQSALVTGMIEANVFTAAERSFYLDGLGQMAQGFAETLVQLIVVELEKLTNAVVDAIYASINTVAGVALSAPRLAAPA